MEVSEIIWLDIFVEKLWRNTMFAPKKSKKCSPLAHVYGEWRVETSLARMYIQLWAQPHRGAI